MKKAITILFLLLSMYAKSQCIDGVCVGHGEGANISPVFLVDNSFKYFQPSGFAGIGIHAGVWVGTLGFTIGGVDSKMNSKSSARRELAFGLMTKIVFLQEKIQAIPFFNIGTNNYQDAGIRIGYKVGEGTYVGAMTSVTMHYGLSVTVAIDKTN